MNTTTRFSADTRKLAYAQAFSRTSTPHVSARPTRVGADARTPLRTLSSRLHLARRTGR